MADKKKNKNRHELKIEVKGEEWKKLVDESFQKVSKEKTVDGFRKGKAPRNLFDKKYGKESYLIEAANKAVDGEFRKVLLEKKYQLVAEPQIHITKLEDDVLEFTMTLIEQPEVVIKKYTGLGVKKDKVKVTNEEIEHQLSHLLERFSELVIKEGTVEKGDIAVIDFEGFIDGVAFDGGKGENYSLEIGSGQFIPGFEEQLIGMKKEEDRDVHVTFPEDYHEESLKGKEAVFKVHVHEIKVKMTREMDEEFFNDLALEGVHDEKALKEEIKKSIEAQKEQDAENKYINDLIEAVSKNAEVDIPEEMVFDTTEMMLEDMKQRLAMQGISYEMYLEFSHQTEEDIKNQMEKEAFARVLARLTLEEIKKLENITVTAEEVDEKLKEMTEKYKTTEEEILKEVGSKEMLRYDLEMNKVIDFLKEKN